MQGENELYLKLKEKYPDLNFQESWEAVEKVLSSQDEPEECDEYCIKRACRIKTCKKHLNNAPALNCIPVRDYEGVKGLCMKAEAAKK